MRREAKRAARRTGLPLRVVEISGDTALEARFGREVPVLVMPGGETLRGRPPRGEVESAFRRATGSDSSLPDRFDIPGHAARRRGRFLGALISVLAWHRRPQS